MLCLSLQRQGVAGGRGVMFHPHDIELLVFLMGVERKPVAEIVKTDWEQNLLPLLLDTDC